MLGVRNMKTVIALLISLFAFGKVYSEDSGKYELKFMPCPINGDYKVELENGAFATPKTAIIGKISDSVDGTAAIPIVVILDSKNLRPTICHGIYLQEEGRVAFQEANINFTIPHCRIWSGLLNADVITGKYNVYYENLNKLDDGYKTSTNGEKTTWEFKLIKQ